MNPTTQSKPLTPGNALARRIENLQSAAKFCETRKPGITAVVEISSVGKPYEGKAAKSGNPYAFLTYDAIANDRAIKIRFVGERLQDLPQLESGQYVEIDVQGASMDGRTLEISGNITAKS